MNTRSPAGAGQPFVKPHLDTFAVGVMLLCTFVWAMGQISTKVGLSGFQPVFQAGLRSALACLLVFAWCAIRNIPLFQRDGTLGAGIVAGLLFSAEFIALFVGLDYTTASRAIVLLYIAPIVVAVGAHFLLGERLTPMKLTGLVAAFGGVVLAFSDHLGAFDKDTLFGDFLCVIAAITWGATTLCVRATRLRHASAEKVLVYQLAVSSVVLLPLSPLFGPLIREVTPLVLLALAYQVIIVVAISYVVWFWLLSRYQASQLSAFSFLTPLMTVTLSWLLLGEAISLRLLGALALVAIGIYLVGRRRVIVPMETVR